MRRRNRPAILASAIVLGMIAVCPRVSLADGSNGAATPSSSNPGRSIGPPGATASAAGVYGGLDTWRAGACVMPDGKVVKYGPPASAKPSADLCSRGGDGVSECRLSGWLYEPMGARKNRAAIVYVHGSGSPKDMTNFCEMVRHFVTSGYVFFVPYMRGYGDKTSAKVDGIGTNPRIANNPPLPPPGTPAGLNFKNTGQYPDAAGGVTGVTTMMKDEISNEIQYAFSYLTSLAGTGGPLVDPHKVVLAGHSFGGIMVTLAASATLVPTPAAIIDISGAVLNWPSDPAGWEAALCDATSNRRMPMFMFQTLSESPLFRTGKVEEAAASTLKPFLCAQTNSDTNGNKGAQLALFTSVPNIVKAPPFCQPTDRDNHCAHTMFVMDHEQVRRWAHNVDDFLATYGIR